MLVHAFGVFSVEIKLWFSGQFFKILSGVYF